MFQLLRGVHNQFIQVSCPQPYFGWPILCGLDWYYSTISTCPTDSLTCHRKVSKLLNLLRRLPVWSVRSVKNRTSHERGLTTTLLQATRSPCWNSFASMCGAHRTLAVAQCRLAPTMTPHQLHLPRFFFARHIFLRTCPPKRPATECKRCRKPRANNLEFRIRCLRPTTVHSRPKQGKTHRSFVSAAPTGNCPRHSQRGISLTKRKVGSQLRPLQTQSRG